MLNPPQQQSVIGSGKMPFLPFSDCPGQRQGALPIQYRCHQRRAPAPDRRTVEHDQKRSSLLRKIGDELASKRLVKRLERCRLVAEKSLEPLRTALCLCRVGSLQRQPRQARSLGGHDASDHPSQGAHVALESLRAGHFRMSLAKMVAHGVVSSYIIAHGKACSVDDCGLNHRQSTRSESPKIYNMLRAFPASERIVSKVYLWAKARVDRT